MKAISGLSLTTLMIAFLCSCQASAPMKRQPKKAAPNIEKEFRGAESLAQKNDAKRAIPRLKKFVQTNPESDLTGDAYFLMGQMHERAQQYQEALTSYTALVNMPVASRYEAEAAIRAARLQVKLGQINEAEAALERIARWKSLTPEQLIEFERIKYEVYVAQKKHLQALESLIVLAERAPVAAERDRYKALAQESLDSRFGEEDIRQIADSSKFSFVRPMAMFRYGLLMAERRLYSSARNYFSEAAQLAKGTELADRANALVTQIDARHRVEPRTIGVVLPLTGKQSAIGYKALRGIQLGLGVYSAQSRPSGFRLAIVDSEGNPDMARHAVDRLVQEDNVIAIIGGVLSKTAASEALKAQEFGVPAIMLSQKAGVTQTGDFVFRNALTSQMQVQFLVDIAMSKLGLKSFAILFPNDAYGIEYANLFWDEVRSRGGDVRGAQPYDPLETDFRGYVQRLVGTFYLEDRADEYRLHAKAWSEKNPRHSGRGAPAPEDLLPPVIDFDALFIPDGAKAVGQIAPMLAYTNVSGTKLIGTNIWNSPAIVTRGQKFVENSLFVDSFLAGDSSFVRSDFFTSFKSVFDEEPGLTEVQAYDSALILRQLIANGETTRAGLQSRMSKVENFPGAIGRLSVDSQREFRRPLSALTVKDGKIVGFENTPR